MSEDEGKTKLTFKDLAIGDKFSFPLSHQIFKLRTRTKTGEDTYIIDDRKGKYMQEWKIVRTDTEVIRV